jgi:hypothetical protein
MRNRQRLWRTELRLRAYQASAACTHSDLPVTSSRKDSTNSLFVGIWHIDGEEQADDPNTVVARVADPQKPIPIDGDACRTAEQG